MKLTFTPILLIWVLHPRSDEMMTDEMMSLSITLWISSGDLQLERWGVSSACGLPSTYSACGCWRWLNIDDVMHWCRGKQIQGRPHGTFWGTIYLPSLEIRKTGRYMQSFLSAATVNLCKMGTAQPTFASDFQTKPIEQKTYLLQASIHWIITSMLLSYISYIIIMAISLLSMALGKLLIFTFYVEHIGFIILICATGESSSFYVFLWLPIAVYGD